MSEWYDDLTERNRESFNAVGAGVALILVAWLLGAILTAANGSLWGYIGFTAFVVGLILAGLGFLLICFGIDTYRDP